MSCRAFHRLTARADSSTSSAPTHTVCHHQERFGCWHDLLLLLKEVVAKTTSVISGESYPDELVASASGCSGAGQQNWCSTVSLLQKDTTRRRSATICEVYVTHAYTVACWDVFVRFHLSSAVNIWIPQTQYGQMVIPAMFHTSLFFNWTLSFVSHTFYIAIHFWGSFSGCLIQSKFWVKKEQTHHV